MFRGSMPGLRGWWRAGSGTWCGAPAT